jgi:hypothetical protein
MAPLSSSDTRRVTSAAHAASASSSTSRSRLSSSHPASLAGTARAHENYRPRSSGGALCRPHQIATVIDAIKREPWRERPRFFGRSPFCPRPQPRSLTPQLSCTVARDKERSIAPAFRGGFCEASAMESSEKCTTESGSIWNSNHRVMRRAVAFDCEVRSAPSRRCASLRPRCARLAALTARPRTSRGNYRRRERNHRERNRERNHLTTHIDGAIVEFSSTAA